MVRTLALAAACLLALATPAAAEWHLVPMAGFTFAGDTTLVDLDHATGNVHTQFGGVVSLLGGGLFGAEAVTVYTPGFFQPRRPVFVKDSRTFALMGNFVFTAPRRWTEYNLRPFASAGFGLLDVSVTDKASTFPVSEHLKGFNVGGGVIGFFTKSTGMRLDFRYFSTLHHSPSDVSFGAVHLRYMTFSAGLVFRR